MSILIKNGYLLIDDKIKCKNETIINYILNLKLKFPDCISTFENEVSQHLVRCFNDYYITIRSEVSDIQHIPWEDQSSLQYLNDDYIYNHGVTFTQRNYNKFLVEIEDCRKYVIGDERKGKGCTYLGLKLIKENNYYKFIELKDCYKPFEEMNKVKFWEKL